MSHLPELVDYACPECGYDGPHATWIEDEVGRDGTDRQVAECGSCYAEFEVGLA